jgi:hypothetical protein
MTSAANRYEEGNYAVEFGDDDWKADQMAQLVAHIPDPESIGSYSDIGCGSGGVFAGIRDRLVSRGFPIQRAVGYDVLPEQHFKFAIRSELQFKRMDFLADDEEFDLITLNDVVEHVLSPQTFLAGIGRRARYVALHIPLDDRLSVLMSNQYNFRIGPVGHISFWSPASALNLATASGLTPLWCCLTPGFMAPSGRVRAIQRAAFVFRWLTWQINPGLMAATMGGASFALLCRGGRR